MTGKVQNRRFFGHIYTYTHINIHINIHTDRTKRLTLLRIRAQGKNGENADEPGSNHIPLLTNSMFTIACVLQNDVATLNLLVI